MINQIKEILVHNKDEILLVKGLIYYSSLIIAVSWALIKGRHYLSERSFNKFQWVHKRYLSGSAAKNLKMVKDFWNQYYKVGNKVRKISKDTFLQVENFNGHENFKENILVRIIDKASMDKIKASHQDILDATAQLCSEYEFLGKLHKKGVFSRSDLKTFFYTNIADAYVACKAYIDYRRKFKKKYATQFSKMAEKIGSFQE